MFQKRALIFSFFIYFTMAQPLLTYAQLGKLLKKADSSLVNSQKLSLVPGDVEIQQGIKEALQKGIQNAVNQASMKDGFLKNPSLKLLFPPEAKKIESTLRELGFNTLCDNIILSMNRSAEEASKKALPIFLTSISQMNLKDAQSILKGKENSATQYFQKMTFEPLKKAFRPSIDSSLNRNQASFYWKNATTTYNKVPFIQKINPDLGDYVTQQSLNGLFLLISQEELKIRKDLNARTSPLLKRVFGYGDQINKP